jgi:hypothetical protein
MAPEVPVDEVPIVPITNGVHRATWTDPEMRFDDLRRPDPSDIWRRHEGLRGRLVARCREILSRDVLDPKALTIGFARRFATYKRAPLVFTDPDRLARLLRAEGRPVQLIFAGKAHPHDEPGKEFLHRIVAFGEEERFRANVIFLPDYDVDLARLLVSGCDVWLNNPERPLEASGTSGMKAGMNGVLNLSALDGWWDEAPREETGFSFGLAQDHPPADVMALALYTALETDVVPLFYERDPEGVPRGWVEKMRNAIDRIGTLFSTDRMLREYVEQCYLPCARGSQKAGDPRGAAPPAAAAADESGSEPGRPVFDERSLGAAGRHPPASHRAPGTGRNRRSRAGRGALPRCARARGHFPLAGPSPRPRRSGGLALRFRFGFCRQPLPHLARKDGGRGNGSGTRAGRRNIFAARRDSRERVEWVRIEGERGTAPCLRFLSLRSRPTPLARRLDALHRAEAPS